MHPGARLGPYEIIAPLGAGGMGEVYRARDPRLERDIALKVLPAETVADETSRARMVREGRMAARLNHPNVCTIYEVGESDGLLYIAMELVEGRSLSTVLGDGPLSAEQALRYGAEIASALAHAHERGVVHRDLKCGNVVITPEERTKVLDFGLAKPLVSDDVAEATTLAGESLTGVGMVAGTLAYMAPEQLRGEGADARSDVWALGVVLYEMLAGRRPFAGKTGPSLSAAILNQAPPPLPDRVPTAVQRVVVRCLAKAADERYRSADEVREALEATRSGVAAPVVPRPLAATSRWRWLLAAFAVTAILAVLVVLDVGGMRGRLFGGFGGGERAVRMAVLPFANLTGDPEQEYLSDGITQEMIAQIGRLHPDTLSVIARTSVLRYKNTATPIDQIGRELKVDYVLEGSAQREGGRVRINAELIRASDQSQLWADSFEREMSGILALQNDVAREVAKALSLKLLPSEQASLSTARPVDPEAHEAYLRGSVHWMKATPSDLDIAEKFFDQALAKDPTYAPAYAGSAWVWLIRNQMGFAPPENAGPKAKAAALRAIELDENLAGAHEVLAAARWLIDWDWDGASQAYRRAIELNPNLATAQAMYAHLLLITGRGDEALTHARRSTELDPFNPMIQGWYAAFLFFEWRYDDAILAAMEARRLQPDHPVATVVLWLAFDGKGMEKEAFEAARAFAEVAYDDQRVTAALDEGYVRGGYAEAMKRCAEALATRLPESFALPTDIASFYAMAGEREKAIEWLEQGLDLHDPALPYIGVWPTFDDLHADPRFQDLLRRMNLPAGVPVSPPHPTGAAS